MPPACLDRFPSSLRSAPAIQDIEPLYSHQATDIDRILAGEDVVRDSYETLEQVYPEHLANATACHDWNRRNRS